MIRHQIQAFPVQHVNRCVCTYTNSQHRNGQFMSLCTCRASTGSLKPTLIIDSTFRDVTLHVLTLALKHFNARIAKTSKTLNATAAKLKLRNPQEETKTSKTFKTLQRHLVPLVGQVGHFYDIGSLSTPRHRN